MKFVSQGIIQFNLPSTPGVHKWSKPLLHSCRASPHWLALISRSTEGRRLSWPGWLVAYGGDLLVWRQSYQ